MAPSRNNTNQFDTEWLGEFRLHRDFLLERFSQKELAAILNMDQGNFSKQVTGIPSKKFRERFYRSFAHLLGQDDPSTSKRTLVSIDRSQLPANPEKPLIAYLDHKFALILEEIHRIRQTLDKREPATRSPTSPK